MEISRKTKSVNVKQVPKETNEEQIFQLECEVSLLSELVIQLIEELRNLGIEVSNKIKG